jgi:hypothetical protein
MTSLGQPIRRPDERRDIAEIRSRREHDPSHNRVLETRHPEPPTHTAATHGQLSRCEVTIPLWQAWRTTVAAVESGTQGPPLGRGAHVVEVEA